MKQGKNAHDSVLVLLSIILVLILFSVLIVWFDMSEFVGRIVAEAGKVVRLDINKEEPAAWWDGIYGVLTPENSPDNYTVVGGNVGNVNLSVPDVNYFLNRDTNIYASVEDVINYSALVPANTSEVDAYMGIAGSDPSSASNTFVNMSNFTINNVSMELFSAYTNSPVEKFKVGILKDSSSGEIVFVTHVKPNGTAFNNRTADFQIMLPVKNGNQATYYLSVGEEECSITISLVGGRNWFSIPCILPDKSISVVLSDLGSGAGTEHEKWSLPGCTGNASDNYQGNYTIIWTYNASNTANPWQSYNPTKPCFQIPNEKLKHITREYNYEININSSKETLGASGTEPVKSEIFMEVGTNWVGYPSSTARNISDALWSIGKGAGTEHEKWSLPGCTGNASDNYQGNYTIIWTYNASNTANPWQSYNPTKPCFQIPNEKLKQLTPGQGYQINMNATDILVIYN